MATVQLKKFRLPTYHERFVHLSLFILRLLARAETIPRDLAYVDPPTCPGFAYGKEIRKRWRYKGMHNLKKIRVATVPGEVVCMDQVISPTPGFYPFTVVSQPNKDIWELLYL